MTVVSTVSLSCNVMFVSAVPSVPSCRNRSKSQSLSLKDRSPFFHKVLAVLADAGPSTVNTASEWSRMS